MQDDFLASWGDGRSGGWPGDTTGRGLEMLMRDLTIQRVTPYRYR